MRKIRIGTDVRLKLRIEPNTMAGFDKIDEFDQSNVKQLRCYLINTSFCKPCCDHECPKHQRVGFPDFYHPTHHNIHNTGFPGYHMAPANICNYDKFSPDFHDFHWWPGYRGFGLYPEHFHEYCGHMHWHGPRPSHYYPHCHNHHQPQPTCVWPEPWYEPFYHGYDHHGIKHCKPDPFDQWLHPEYVPVDVFGKENVVLNHPHPYAPYYLCDSQVLNEKNTLTCMFPAVQQKMCGTYKLVVVLTVFEQGWGRHNLRTYTIDKGDVFDLVDTETGESGAITIDVDSTGGRENLIDTIWSDDYIMASNTSIAIGGYDITGKEYQVYVKLKDGTKVVYNPSDWRYNQLIFEPEDDTLLTIDKDGTLHSADVDEPVTVEVTVYSADRDPEDTEGVGHFTVTIKPLSSIKLGFSITDELELVHPEDKFLREHKIDPKKVYTAEHSGEVVNNEHVNGKYLWIASQRRIKYIYSQEEDSSIVTQLSSGIRVPSIDYEKPKEGYYWYRSIAPIRSGKMYIKIVFA